MNTTEPEHRTAVSSRVLGGAAVGAGAAVLAVAFGFPGLSAFALAAVVSAFVPPRFAFLGGLLFAAGAIWTFFGVRAAIACAVAPASCSGTSPVPFALVSAVVLTIAVVLLARTRVNASASSDIRRR